MTKGTNDNLNVTARLPFIKPFEPSKPMFPSIVPMLIGVDLADGKDMTVIARVKPRPETSVEMLTRVSSALDRACVKNNSDLFKVDPELLEKYRLTETMEGN